MASKNKEQNNKSLLKKDFVIQDGFIKFASCSENLPKILKWAAENNIKLGKEEVYQEHSEYIFSMYHIMDPKDKGWLFLPIEDGKE